MALTPKQERFVAEYLIDLNATQAAIRAGYSKKNADKIGSELLGKTRVARAIQQAQKDRQVRTEITQDMVLRECAKLAFFDIRKLLDKDGILLDISALDDDIAAAIIGLDIQDIHESQGNKKNIIGYIKKYKLADKLKAIELLGKHLGLWQPKDDVPQDESKEDELSQSLRELGKELKND